MAPPWVGQAPAAPHRPATPPSPGHAAEPWSCRRTRIGALAASPPGIDLANAACLGAFELDPTGAPVPDPDDPAVGDCTPTPAWRVSAEMIEGAGPEDSATAVSETEPRPAACGCAQAGPAYRWPALLVLLALARRAPRAALEQRAGRRPREGGGAVRGRPP